MHIIAPVGTVRGLGLAPLLSCRWRGAVLADDNIIKAKVAMGTNDNLNRSRSASTAK
jgi:hypothetical protein